MSAREFCIQWASWRPQRQAGRELNLRLGRSNWGSSIQGVTRVSAPLRSWLESQNAGVPWAVCVVVSLLKIISCRCPLEFSDVTYLA